MTTATGKTVVLFRTWKAKPHTCLALFPECSVSEGLVQSFEHTGQHGGADYVHCIRSTRPAKPEEYDELKGELERIGYNLAISTRARRQ